MEPGRQSAIPLIGAFKPSIEVGSVKRVDTRPEEIGTKFPANGHPRILSYLSAPDNGWHMEGAKASCEADGYSVGEVKSDAA